MSRRAFVPLLGLLLLCPVGPALAVDVAPQLPMTRNVTLAYPATYSFRFSVLDAPASTRPLYAETKSIRLTGRTLRFVLGAGTRAPGSPALRDLDWSRQFWVKVERRTAAGFEAVGAPQRLAIVPYAFWSGSSGAGGTGGSVTSVGAGGGLTGGGVGDVTVAVGQGTGINVAADAVSVDTTWADGRFVNEGQASVTLGTITASNVTFSPARSRIMSIPYQAFSSEYGDVPYGANLIWGKHLASGTGYLSAPVLLPQGAVVTYFAGLAYDNSPSVNLKFELVTIPGVGLGSTTMATVTTAASGGYQGWTTGNITAATVANDANLYMAFVSPVGGAWPGNDSLAVRGVVVGYSVTEAP